MLLLENIRFYKEEKENSYEFGRELASFSDVYVNNAFSVSHRNHASVTQIPLFIPSAGGLLFKKELEVLDKVLDKPKRPLVVIIGGAKIESKLASLDYFLKEADHVLLGGKIANALLIATGIMKNFSGIDSDILKLVRDTDHTSNKLHLPVDVITAIDANGSGGEVKETAPARIEQGRDVFDIGSETRNLYGELIKEAGTIIWAGPLGLSEVKSFEGGTKEIAESVVNNKNALKVIGGGDTSRAFRKLGFFKQIDLVSCGGGAMLTYLTRGAMPGIESLKYKKENL